MEKIVTKIKVYIDSIKEGQIGARLRAEEKGDPVCWVFFSSPLLGMGGIYNRYDTVIGHDSHNPDLVSNQLPDPRNE